MRFLFIGPGYPGAEGTSHGSGIGTYLREITLGLVELGHECHVVAWGMQSEVRSQKSEVRSQMPTPQQRNNLTTQQLPFQDVNGIRVFLLPHAYWPILERFMPDSRDVWNMRQMVKRLDREYQYDWIEIQCEEGIGIGVQKDFADKTILRAHTTLLQMVEYKGEGKQAEGSGLQTTGQGEKDVSREVAKDAKGKDNYNIVRQDTQDMGAGNSSCISMLSPSLPALQPWKLRYRLRRERRSFQVARRIVTHSKAHAEEIKKLYPGIVEPAVVWHGVGVVNNQQPTTDNRAAGVPTFLIIGTPDRRKGFDRIRPVLEAYAAKYGPCRCVIVGGGVVNGYSLLVNGGERKTSDRIEIKWKSELSADELAREYDNASVYLHLARYESFGVPLIEAAAHGVPIVSTRVGIAPELLEGVLGEFLVNGDDPEPCAEAIVQAIRNRERLSALLLQRYKECYTRNQMVQSYLEKLG